VIERLRGRGVPFVLATGYGAAAEAGLDSAPVIEKPFTRDRVESALLLALGSSAQPRTP